MHDFVFHNPTEIVFGKGSIAGLAARLAVDEAGNVYAAGAVAGTETYDFGNGVRATGTAPNGGPVAGMLSANVLVVKYTPASVAEWARTLAAGADSSSFSSVTVDSAGSVYAAGVIADGPYDFGNDVTAQGTLERGALTGLVGPNFPMLVKYDSLGVAQGARTVATGGPSSRFDSVAVGPAGAVYVAGSVYGQGTYDFGNDSAITSPEGGTSYVLLVKYDADGSAEWARSSENAGSGFFASVAVDSARHLYAAGGVDASEGADFGNAITVRGTEMDTVVGWSALLVSYQ
jgi:hypothetical protein